MKVFGPGSDYFLSSSVEKGQLEDLEHLFYFNPNQWKLRKSLQAAVEEYGSPQIVESAGKWRVILPKMEGAQSLYLFRKGPKPELAGLILYVRKETFLKVLYWGLRPEFTAQALKGRSLLVEMMDALRDIGASVSGVQNISFNLGSHEYHLPTGSGTARS